MPTPRRYADHAARQAAYRLRLGEARTKELAARRMPALPTIATLPGEARWRALTRQAALLLQTALEEMQDYYEQRSDTWQESERGEAFRERLEALQETQALVDELCC